MSNVIAPSVKPAADFVIQVAPQRTHSRKQRSSTRAGKVANPVRENIHAALKRSRTQMVQSGLIACGSIVFGVSLGVLSVSAGAYFILGSAVAHFVAYFEINQLRSHAATLEQQSSVFD